MSPSVVFLVSGVSLVSVSFERLTLLDIILMFCMYTSYILVMYVKYIYIVYSS